MDKVNNKEYNNFPDKTVFTTLEWLNYLKKDKNVIPLIIRIKKLNKYFGYFTGGLFKKFGITILGSPFMGWTTNYMGFNIYDYSECEILIDEIVKYIFHKTKCVYIELIDRNIIIKNLNRKYSIEPIINLEIDITKNEESLFKSFKKDCREYIRQFERRGAIIEMVKPDKEFIEELYRQLKNIFFRQKLNIPFEISKIYNCVENLKNTNMIYCFRVKEPNGIIIASYIFVGYKKRIIAWCTSSNKNYLHYRPNEYIIWYSLKKFKEFGFETFDFSGKREYKYKWNPKEIELYRITITKFKILQVLRNLALKMFWILAKIKVIPTTIKILLKKLINGKNIK